MPTRVCPNLNCVAFAHVIYTGATRCLFCKWDLKAPQRATDVSASAQRPEPADDARFLKSHR
jgi:hypothetical protein